MNEIFENLKQIISADNIKEFLKEAKLVDEDNLKQEEVKETAEKMDPEDLVNVDDVPTKLSDMMEQSKAAKEETKSQGSVLGGLSVLQKPAQQQDLTEEEEMAKHEDIIALNS